MEHLKKDIKIFVSHRVDLESENFCNPLLIPVRCGAVYDKAPQPALPGDDTGDNISQKHPLLSELTVQYWAWKNQKADYYGLCHYRRFWNFSETEYPITGYGTVTADYIGKQNQKKFALEEASMRRVIEAHDLVVTKPIDVRSLPGRFRNVKDHYCHSTPALKQRDFEVMEALLQERCPEMWPAAKAYFSGRRGYFCNMGIMRSDIFHGYCAWLYPLLFRLEELLDMTHYSEEGLRTIGHLAERLFGVYITHLKKTRKDLKILHLQTVVFTNPEKLQIPQVSADSVKVVLAANNAFAEPLSVCLKSALMNADRNRKFDFIVLSSDIDRDNQKTLKGMFMPYPNAKLHFVNAMPYLQGYTLKAHAHITVETFFRFLIQNILPDCGKAIYLDADTLVRRDLGALYDTPLDGCMLGATKDPDFIGQMCGAIPGIDEYARDVLQLSDPYSYFQAGVLLFDLNEMRKAYSMEQWLELASQDFRYSDQDVLNKYCQGRVKFLDMRWNVLYDCDNYRVSQVISRTPKQIKDAYMASREDPYIIHYAGFVKPWQRLPVDFGQEFWRYAQQSPYYEQLIYKMTVNDRLSPAQTLASRIKHAIRNIVDRIFPLHTPAREKLKRFLRSLGLLN